MNFTYEVGMPVCLRGNKGFKGVVTEVDGEYDVKVSWDDDDKVGEWSEVSEMMPDTPEVHAQLEEMAKKAQAKVDEAASLLESAFKAWREAQTIYTGYDGQGSAYQMRQDGLVILSKFEGIINREGWSTSSIYC
jgi:hypothetical protein